MRHRPSSLKAYGQCPFKARDDYYHPRKVRRSTPRHFLLGHCVHAIIEQRIKGEAFRESFPPDIMAEAYALTPNFGDYLPIGWTDRIISVEERYEIELSPDVLFGGIPDLVLSGEDEAYIDIVDWKTAHTAQGYERDQFLDYAGILSAQEQFLHIEGFRRWTVFLRLGYYMTEVITPEEAADHITHRINVINNIEELGKSPKNWPATAGTHCEACRAKCPYTVQDLIHDGQIMNEKTAREVAHWIVANEAQIKTTKANLKVWCAENGPVGLIPGQYLGFKDQQKRSFDVDGLLKALSPKEFLDIVGIDVRKFDKMVKARPSFLERAMPYIEITHKDKFTTFKGDENGEEGESI